MKEFNSYKKMHKHKMAVDGYFCYGYEDTPESILKTHEFILDSGIDVVNTPIIIPSPGTTQYKKLEDKIEYKNFPEDWNKYLGRLVYHPKYSSKKDFYKAYIRTNEELISFKEILKRAFTTLWHSRSPILAFIMFLINLNYKKLRRDHLDIVLEQDDDFRAAFDELNN